MPPGKLEHLRAGVYRHYKGQVYLVLGYASDADYTGRDVVVYVGLELDGAQPGARMHVRTASEFRGLVKTSDGHFVPRFSYLGPEWAPS
jgi:hypothetical protein